MHLYLTVSMLLLLAFDVTAEVYKWTDADGQVHYGDRPHDSSSAEEINVDEETSTGFSLDDGSRSEKRQRLLDAMEEDRREKEAQREKNRVEQEKRNRQCIQLKDKLRRVESATGVYNLDKEGKRVFLTSDQRKHSEDELRAKIRKYCK